MDDTPITKILFKADKENLLPLVRLILHEANERSYFNPTLDKGQLFDLFEHWALSYQTLHDLHYDPTDTQHNMRAFFDVYDTIDTAVLQDVKGVFEELSQTGIFIERSGLDAQVTFSSEDPHAFVLELPMDDTEMMPVGTDPFNEETQPQETPKIQTDDVFRALYERMNQHIVNEPYVYQKINARIKALGDPSQPDATKATLAMRAAFDILLNENNHTESLNSFDVIDFLYDIDGTSLLRIGDYVTQQSEHVTLREKTSLPHYEGAIQLQRHFLEIEDAIERDPHTHRQHKFSQWLFVYADMIEAFSLAYEEDF